MEADETNRKHEAPLIVNVFENAQKDEVKAILVFRAFGL